MRIIVPGQEDKRKTARKYTCYACDCLFEAEESEYSVGVFCNTAYEKCVCPYCGATVMQTRR